MSALLLLLSLSFAEAPRPDTKTAIHGVVIEVAALTEAKDYEGARALLDAHQEEMQAAPERTWFERWSGEAPAALEVRALLTHARGVLEMQAGELAPAAEALARARAEAGPGLLRLCATYDLGVLHLEEGELYRAQIPELSNGAVAPPPAAPDGEEPGDPLDLARAQYLKARAWFIERLSLDWQDADTRANVELVQRRLRELDELEREREEQEQEEQEQKEGDGESEEGEEGEESSEDEEQPGEDSQENAEGEREPEEPGEGEEEEEEQEDEDEASESEAEELHLTQEEMQRLLDALREIEEEGADVQEALRRVGRQGVDRDW